MKILLDEDAPLPLRRALDGHDVFSTQYVGWSGLKNGELVAAAETNGYEIFITCDRDLEYQQNLSGRRIAIILLSAQEWPILKEHLDVIRRAVDSALPGTYQRVECGKFQRGKQKAEISDD